MTRYGNKAGSEDGGGNGAVDIPLTEEWGVQLDLIGEAAFPKGDSTNVSQSYGGQAILGGHINYREVNEFLVGVFVGGGNGILWDDDTTTSAADPSLITAGVEGQMYFDDLTDLGQVTAYGQGGYVHSWQPGSNNTLEEAWFLRGVGRLFLNHGMTKVAGEASFAQGDSADTSADIDIFGWAFEGEHQFANWGADDGYASAFLRYEGRYFNDSADGSEEYFENTILAGIRFAFNQMSLLSAERTGPAVDLPNVGRWVVGTRAMTD